MHVIVVGAGVVGMATALRLALDGHTVEVMEAAAMPASGASFANAGLISPGHCFSWAEPGVVPMALKSLFGGVAGFGIARPLHPALWRWGWRFARQSTLPRWLANSAAALSLSRYSRTVHARLGLIAPARYGGRSAGILYCYGPGAGPAQAELDLLRQAGEGYEVLDGAALLDREPVLGAARGLRFETAVHCPGDATGDARRYALAACEAARERGARVHVSTPVGALVVSAGRVRGVATPRGVFAADAVVVAAGEASAALLRPLGYAAPVYPVTGYSLTFAARDLPPLRRGGVSATHKIAWSPLGEQAIRMTGFADVGTPGRATQTRRLAQLRAFATALMPALAAVEPSAWVGRRPMTPDGLPVLGAGAHPGLYLNFGHGAMGWTMASGSAQVIAHLLQGTAPEIDAAPFRVQRF